MFWLQADKLRNFFFYDFSMVLWVCHGCLSVILKVKEMPVFRRNCAFTLKLSLGGWCFQLILPSTPGQVTLTHSSGRCLLLSSPGHHREVEGHARCLFFTHLTVLSASGQHISWKRNNGETIQKNEDATIIYFLTILKLHISDMERQKIRLCFNSIYLGLLLCTTYCG